MRDISYKIKAIRMSEEMWEELKKEKQDSGLSWNLFLKQLLNLYKDLN